MIRVITDTEAEKNAVEVAFKGLGHVVKGRYDYAIEVREADPGPVGRHRLEASAVADSKALNQA
jgi:hypothetical protein